jgi:hypothetical protein
MYKVDEKMVDTIISPASVLIPDRWATINRIKLMINKASPQLDPEIGRASFK